MHKIDFVSNLCLGKKKKREREPARVFLYSLDIFVGV